MPYTKNSWEPGDIITAAKLNHMEDGIAASDLSESVKTALLQIAAKVAYIDDQGQEYYDALEEALYPEKTLTSITAEYTQTSTVYATTSLDSLKSDLVVTANYDDASTATVTTYTLSGTLSVGTSTITATYSGFTDTFEVTVSAAPTVSSIAAVYTQSGTVYTTDTLDSLKADLVVTATYSDTTTATVPSADYTLSGTLTVGTSTVTVTYESKTTSFNVTVTEQGLVPAGYTQYDYVKYTGVDRSSTTTAKQSIIATKTFSDLNVLKLEFDISPHTAKTSAAGILGGHAASTGNNYTVSFYGRTDTQRVSAFSHGTALALENIPDMQVGSIVHVVLDPGSASPSTLLAGELSTTGAWTSSQTIYAALGYCGQWMLTNSTLVSFASIGILKIYDQSNTLVGQYVPCVRDADNVIGIWDTVTEEFYTSATVGYATIGGDSCEWAVGNWEV